MACKGQRRNAMRITLNKRNVRMLVLNFGRQRRHKASTWPGILVNSKVCSYSGIYYHYHQYYYYSFDLLSVPLFLVVQMPIERGVIPSDDFSMREIIRTMIKTHWQWLTKGWKSARLFLLFFKKIYRVCIPFSWLHDSLIASVIIRESPASKLLIITGNDVHMGQNQPQQNTQISGQ